MTATEAAQRDAASRNDELIDAALIRGWLAWGLGWLLFFPTLGALHLDQVQLSEFLGDTAWLTFGRLRPMHVNGVIWGAFSTLFIGLCYYIVPAPLPACASGASGWSRGLLWIWNLNLARRRRAAGARLEPRLGGGRAAADQRGRDVPGARPCLTVQFLMTIKQRRSTGRSTSRSGT